MSCTHYSYLSGPNNMRQPVGMYDLNGVSLDMRRQLMHELMKEGEMLCHLPDGVTSTKDLAEILQQEGH